MIDEIQSYAKNINANDEVLTWIKTTGKKSLIKKIITVSSLEHIIDYLNSNAAPRRLQRMSIKDAERKAKEWSDRNKKKGKDLIDSDTDIDIVHDFENGSMIVKLKTKKSYQREGFMMSHCLGGYDDRDSDCIIYSYRDADNNPHATFEVRRDASEIVQIKGKGNGSIHPKYVEPILIFLEILEMNIRPSDMVNLGYYHLNKIHVDYLKEIPDAWKQIVLVRDEYYGV